MSSQTRPEAYIHENDDQNYYFRFIGFIDFGLYISTAILVLLKKVLVYQVDLHQSVSHFIDFAERSADELVSQK